MTENSISDGHNVDNDNNILDGQNDEAAATIVQMSKKDLRIKYNSVKESRADLKDFVKMLMKFRQDSLLFNDLPYVTNIQRTSSDHLRDLSETFLDVLFETYDTVDWDEEYLLQSIQEVESESDDGRSSTVSKILTRSLPRHSMTS